MGAKLSLRFPELVITNDSYTTADQQTARPRDFKVGDTAFHITLSPTESLWSNRCRANLQHGFRVHVLVPDRLVDAARNLAAEVYLRFPATGDRCYRASLVLPAARCPLRSVALSARLLALCASRHVSQRHPES